MSSARSVSINNLLARVGVTTLRGLAISRIEPIISLSIWTAAIFLLVLAHAFVLQPVAADSCACGSQTALLVLVEFPDYPHLASRSQISHLFLNTVSHYFTEISYGKLSLNGNVTNWITLPQLYAHYAPAGNFDIERVAKDSFSVASQNWNLTSFNDFVLVLSFYPDSTGEFIMPKNPVITTTGTVRGFAVVEEDQDWPAYAHALSLSMGLWKWENRIVGLRSLDIGAGGSGDMSGWSKLQLGWINDTQVLSSVIPPAKVIHSVNSIENAGGRIYAIRIFTGEGEYFLEARQPIGYDQLNRDDHGVAVLFIPENTNLSISFRAFLEPESVSKATYLDLGFDLSFTVLNETATEFSVLVGSVQDGRDAQRALYTISQADSAIQIAEGENRIAGLDLAQQLTNNAHDLFTEGRFQEATALASSAQITAQAAVVPPDYGQSIALIAQAEALRIQVQGVSSMREADLLNYGNTQLQLAQQSFIAKDFTLSRQQAQAAIDTYNSAKQIEVTDQILKWVSIISLTVPVIILAIVLRYQLRGN